MDAAQLACTNEIEEQARNLRSEREEAGVGDRYSEMQPTSMPTVDTNLVRKWLDVCFDYKLDGSNDHEL